MKRSAAQHRERHRKVFAWSFAAAISLHIALFILSPELRVQVLGDPAVEAVQAGPPPALPWALDVRFGPPTLTAPDGTSWPEPADRVLDTVRLIELPTLCAAMAHDEMISLRGSVHLQVNVEGHAAVIELVESTGTACGDHLLRSVAGDLHYHWLPTSRFPAPLDLVQPVRLMAN